VADSLDTLHKEALDRFRFVREAERDQREREIEALKFKAGDQWPDEIKTARAGLPASSSTPAVPARPMLTIRTLDQPISQVVNQGRVAQLAIKVSPRKDATIQDADVFEGLVRNIEHESHAQTAYLWAYERAVIAGRGYFRIDKRWADEEGGFDQVACIDRVLNQGSVYVDPFAQMADWSDGMWAFVTEDLPRERYAVEYPDSELAKRCADDAYFTSIGDDLKDWFPGETAGKCCRVAEYFFVTFDKSTQSDESDEGRKREIQARVVNWGKLNGVEWLNKPQEWDGPDIPIVPVLGMEYNVGGKRCFQGMVEPAMDSCRMINYMASSLAEQAGLASRAPYIGYAGQFESFEAQWQAANTRNQPFLEVNATTDATGANILPMPERNLASPPIDAMTTSIAVFTNFVRSTTGVPDAALGHVNPNDKSGKAIEALKQSSEQSTSNYLDNLARAIQRGGEILVNLIPKIYDRPGRVVQILGADEVQESVMVNKPFVQQKGQPVPVNGQPPQGAEVEHYDLAKGRYNVVVEVGKSFSTRREEGMVAMSALMQANPQMAPIVADLWVGDMDFPGAQAISERLKKALPQQFQDPQDGQPPIPPQVQQQLAVSGKLIEELSAHVNELTKQIDSKQVEMQAKLAEAKMDNETKLAIARLQVVAQLAAVDAKVNAENARTFVEAAEQRIAMQVGALKEHTERAHTHAHEHALQKADHAHERQLAETQHEQALQQAEQGQQHALEQGQQEADLAPEPAAPG
jgi:hypothetical protein